jgi:hypothetical protein
MLEISLSAVAAFAAYTFYAITSDLKAAKQPTIKDFDIAPETVGAVKMPKVDAEASTPMPTAAPKQKAAPKPKAAASKPKAAKAEKPTKAPDPVDMASATILAYLSANGAVTLGKLAKDIPSDKDTLMKAAEKLISENAVVSVKRGGHPGIAPVAN